MKFKKRGKDEQAAEEAASYTPPATVSWPAPEPEPDPPEPAVPEPAVLGEAVELGSEPLPASTPVARPVPLTMPGSTAAHGPAPTPLSSAAAAGAPVADGHGPDPLMDPLKELAAERPEVVVGAAFAGGILAAMILRRLGN